MKLQVSCLPVEKGSLSLVVPVLPVLPSIHTLQQAAGCAAPPENVLLISQSSKSRFRSKRQQVSLLTLKQGSLQDHSAG